MSLLQLANVTVMKDNFVSVCMLWSLGGKVDSGWGSNGSIIIHPRGDIRMLSYVPRQTVKVYLHCIQLYKVEAQKLFSVDSSSSQQHTR